MIHCSFQSIINILISCWNYFLNIYKTVSSSPFSNAIVFVDSGATITLPTSVTFTVSQKLTTAEATILTFTPADTATLSPTTYQFVQTLAATEGFIAVDKFGTVTIPASYEGDGVALEINLKGTSYTSGNTLVTTALAVGDTITLTKAE